MQKLFMSKAQSKKHCNDYYNDSFYADQMDRSYKSAKKYVEFLSTIYKPNSVVDVGCGRGAWLKAFKENGAEKIVGFDGDWNHQNKMIDQSIKFYNIDLNKPLVHKEKYELAISLEVAEHLDSSSAQNFIELMTHLSEVVIFSAAYTKQGGINHINEQPNTYWANLFKSYNYFPYDLFRPIFWGNNDIAFWYQQNTFLYIKQDSAIMRLITNAGYCQIENISFMDCIHPYLYNCKLSQIDYLEHLSVIKFIAKKIIPKSIQQSLRRLVGLI